MSVAIDATAKVREVGTGEINGEISTFLKGASKNKLSTTLNKVEQVVANDEAGAYYQEIAFEEWGMLIDKFQGTTFTKQLIRCITKQKQI